MASSERTLSSAIFVLLFILNVSFCDAVESYNINVTSATQDLKQPKLLVFNLDLVIWPFRVDQDLVTPVKKNKRTGKVQDFVLKVLGVYSHSLDALNTLYLKKIRMAAISDSPDVETNTKLLLYFNLYHYFPIQEIFGGPKTQHLELIHRTTQIPYQDIFYFDERNDQLDSLRQLGVQVIETDTGVEIKDFEKALEIYNNKTISNTLAPTTSPQ